MIKQFAIDATLGLQQFTFNNVLEKQNRKKGKESVVHVGLYIIHYIFPT